MIFTLENIAMHNLDHMKQPQLECTCIYLERRQGQKLDFQNRLLIIIE